MKCIFFMAVGLLLTVSVTAQTQTRLIDLRIDHFNPLDRRTFDARYFINREDWFAGGPLFIYVPGGFEDYTQFLTAGAVFEISHDTNGLMAALEPRYFGESRPTPDTTAENLQWLTIHQQLADLAQFIGLLKANYYGASNSRVILFGRGYGGSLALWARQKYPNLVDGVWASSAPINAVSEYPQSMQNTYYSFNSIGGHECGQVMTGAFRMIEDSIRTGNMTYVTERLQLCTPVSLEIEEELSMLYLNIAHITGGLFLTNARYTEVDAACRTMLAVDTPDDPPANDLDAFARWLVDEYKVSINMPCLNHFYIRDYLNASWDSVSTSTGRRQSEWLTCTQLGQFPISNNGENHPFGWRFEFDFFVFMCGEIFGRELMTADFMRESIARTNEFFGGLNPHVYRAFLTHGEMDPKRNLGPSADLNPQSPVVVMSLQSFSRDFGSPDETDYVVLHETKARARELIIKWIFDSIGEDQSTTQIVPIMH